MDLSRIKITKEQKKLIAIASAAVFLFTFFVLFLYLPSFRRIKELKNEFIFTQQKINEIEKLLAGPQGRDETMRLLKEKQQLLENRFPKREEESLKAIPEGARKRNIEVVSLNAGSKAEFLDEAGQQVKIKDKVVTYLPINMEVTCYYKDLARYIAGLKSNLPEFIDVISVNIQKENQITGRIRAKIEFNLYLLI